MRRDALTYIDLYCTASAEGWKGSLSSIASILLPVTDTGQFVITGYLECPNCGKHYPVLDGVPRFIDGVHSDSETLSQYLDAQYGDINPDYWSEMGELEPGHLHLDIGCGTGQFTFECARRGFAVGIDVTIDYLLLAAAYQRGESIKYRRKTRTLAETTETSSFQPSSNVPLPAGRRT